MRQIRARPGKRRSGWSPRCWPPCGWPPPTRRRAVGPARRDRDRCPRSQRRPGRRVRWHRGWFRHRRARMLRLPGVSGHRRVARSEPRIRRTTGHRCRGSGRWPGQFPARLRLGRFDRRTASGSAAEDTATAAADPYGDHVWREATRTGHDSQPAPERDVWSAATRVEDVAVPTAVPVDAAGPADAGRRPSVAWCPPPGYPTANPHRVTSPHRTAVPCPGGGRTHQATGPDHGRPAPPARAGVRGWHSRGEWQR